jgi:uncharacterized protein with von Willebrand factor type A (vWA) domain
MHSSFSDPAARATAHRAARLQDGLKTEHAKLEESILSAKGIFYATATALAWLAA